MKRNKRISEVIVDEHRSLSTCFEKLLGVTFDAENFFFLKALLHRMSACHYSEEITVYDEANGIVLDEGNSYKSFHAMLDNLHESIKLGGPWSDALSHELTVLRALSNIHFTDEERHILPAVEKQIDSINSRKLAKQFQRSVRELCEQSKLPDELWKSALGANPPGARKEAYRAETD